MAAASTMNNKIISSKRFWCIGIMVFKDNNNKNLHINIKHTLMRAFNRANHALCRCYTSRAPSLLHFVRVYLLLSFHCNFHQGCNCFFFCCCCLIVAWSPPIFRRTKKSNIKKCVECWMIHGFWHEKSDLLTRFYNVLLRVIHFFSAKKSAQKFKSKNGKISTTFQSAGTNTVS